MVPTEQVQRRGPIKWLWLSCFVKGGTSKHGRQSGKGPLNGQLFKPGYKGAPSGRTWRHQCRDLILPLEWNQSFVACRLIYYSEDKIWLASGVNKSINTWCCETLWIRRRSKPHPESCRIPVRHIFWSLHLTPYMNIINSAITKVWSFCARIWLAVGSRNMKTAFETLVSCFRIFRTLRRSETFTLTVLDRLQWPPDNPLCKCAKNMFLLQLGGIPN